MSLLTEQLAYKPFRYPWAYEAWKMQQQIHWLPWEVPLADDVRDWNKRLTPAERNLLTQVFRFFTQADIEVNECYMQKYAQVFKPTEVRMMLAAFSSTETIHIAAYSHLLDTIGIPEAEYEAFLKYNAMRAKHDYLRAVGSDGVEDLARTLAIFGAFTEGTQLFASFAILLNFPRHSKMTGMGQIVSWSARDESLHAQSIIRLFNTLSEEHPTLLRGKTFLASIVQACRDTVNLEDAFIDLAFEMGGVQGLQAAEIKNYIRYIADRRLRQLQLDPIYKLEENPLPWMDEILNGLEHANFFEARSTEYSRAATQGTWDEAFA